MNVLLALNGESQLERCRPGSAGVGLIRGEYLVRQAGCWITEPRCQQHIASYLDAVATTFAGLPVWYRTIDMETTEANLQAGIDHAVHERYSILGMRGVRRALAFGEAFADEADVLARLARQHDNLHVTLPFVQQPQEVTKLLATLRQRGFCNRVGMMAEIPAALVDIASFVGTGISQITVGMNDLSSLVMGAARGSAWSRPMSPAMARLLEHARQVTRKHGLALTMAGHLDEECVEFARRTGFDAVIMHLADAAARRFIPAGAACAAVDCSTLTQKMRVDLAAHAERRRIPDQDWEYLEQVCTDLGTEMREAACETAGAESLALEADGLTQRVRARPVQQAWAHWQAGWHAYDALCARVVRLLDAGANVAQCYPSMEAFWADAELQATGKSPHTFWDTYEHGGRRRLEDTVASTYRAESALLLNSGMSAVSICLEMLNLRPGDIVITDTRSYFETTDLLEGVLGARGVVVRRVPFADAPAALALIATAQPRAVLFETATNCPWPSSPTDVSQWATAAPECVFICDNTVQGCLTPLFGDAECLATRLGRRLVAVESATKYLCHGAMAGLVYGDSRWVEMARLYARRTGQQLQGRAFRTLRPGELRAARKRMALHARNVAAFAMALADHPGLFNGVRCLGPERPSPTALVQPGALGALLYLQLPTGAADLTAAYRAVLTTWKRRAARAGVPFDIRAGFGWRRTSARAYETTKLNQPDAPNYLRLSVGIEPPAWVDTLSACLVAATREELAS